MEFADFILAHKISTVVLHTPHNVKIEGPLCITGHHMIVSSKSDSKSEIWNVTHKPYEVFPTWPFRDLSNCTLHVTATELVPFVFPPDENGEFTDGIEVRAFIKLSHVLNFTYKFIPVPEGENPWLSFINGKPGGFIGTLARGESDIVLSGSRLNYERCTLADPLNPYISDDFIWAGPSSERAPHWKAIFLVFSLVIWISVGTTFIISLLFVLFIYRKTFPTSSAVLLIWIASLSNSSPTTLLPTSSITRCFLAVFLFYALTINSLYTSALYGALTNGFKIRTVDSNMEAAERGWRVSMNTAACKDIHDTIPTFYKLITENNLAIWSNDYLPCLRRAARYGDCFILYTGLGSRYQINMRFTSRTGRRYVRIMKKRYKSYVPTIYMARHHPLFPVFRTRLQQLVENGWIEMQAMLIMTESLRKRYIYSEVEDLSEVEEQKTLSLDQLFGAFLVLSILLILATIAFICELLTDFVSRAHDTVHGKLIS